MARSREKIKGRVTSHDNDRHVRLYHWVMKSAAWRGLDCVARAAYVELSSLYTGSNNGAIGLSVRVLADALHVSPATASRALLSLEKHGFIVTTQKGAFKQKVRHASTYRLTEFPMKSNGEVTSLATKDFAKWTPPANGQT